MVTSPPNYAMYSQGGPVGILPYQNMFVTDSTRSGQFAARNSFVRFLNYIFAQNPISTDRAEAVASLSVESPITPYLSWRRTTGTTHIEVVPPSTEWDYQVYTPFERDRLLLNPTLIAAIMNGQSFRVLVNGLGNEDQPQWSVWTAALTNAPSGTTEDQILLNPSLVYGLTKAYDFTVASFVDRNFLPQAENPIQIGQRVLVTGDSTTGGFWTVWKYAGVGADNADAQGFVLTRYQTYRTADFWNYVDYYASGYSASAPPIVTYATSAARDLAENPPKSSLVKILNDGTGVWIWTAYVNGSWTMVARQNGTIEFSPNFYLSPSAPTIGLQPISMSDLAKIQSRDGSWELRVMFDILQDANLLEAVEVNQMFFSMLHFVHAQQDQVAWAFKTSFMNIGGYNEELTQTPVTPPDNTTNLTKYVQEVAPYRVKIRTFNEIISPPLDNATVHATDFDFPPYFDSYLGEYRNLSIDNPIDLAIIQNTAPWSDWYSIYTQPEYRAENYLAKIWNGVRHFTIKMNFDRVDFMPVITSQTFTYLTTSANPEFITIDPTNTQIVDLRYQIVEVFINGILQPASAYDYYNYNVVLSNAATNGDQITVTVRQALTSGLAADRITQFYNPTGKELPEDNLRTLMGLNQKGNLNDGGDLANNSVNDYVVDGNYTGAESDEAINPNSPRHFGLADPLFEEDRPEELVAIGLGESVNFFDYINGALTVISQSRPGSDLLAPDQIGDFDAGPFESISYDRGYAQAMSFIANSNSSVGQYVIRRDSWQTSTSNVGGTLATDLYANANAIMISISGGVMPFTMPVVELVNDDDGSSHQVTTAPGVVWINGERIEFFEFELADSVVTLNQIRRSTHGTRAGVEQRLLAQYAGDGTTTEFMLAGETTPTNVYVAVNQPLRGYNGGIVTTPDYNGSANVNVQKQINTDFNIAANANGVVVTFLQPPALNTTVILASTDSIKQPAGSAVYDGGWSFYSPIDPTPDIGNGLTNVGTAE